MTDTTEFAEWAILELMGHRRVAGYVREVTLAGAGFLRLDIPAPVQQPATRQSREFWATQYISPSSVYALHPTTEEIATAAAANFRPAPVARWELERAASPADLSDDDKLTAVYDAWPGSDEDDEDGSADG